MARVLLVLPPWYRFLGEGFNEIPLGLSYISAVLRQQGHETAVLNCDLVSRGAAGPEKVFTRYGQYKQEFEQFNDPIWNQIKREIKEFNPDYLGIQTKTAAIKSVLKVAEIAKSLNPATCVVAGGAHATLMPQEMCGMPNIDFVVKGEGEQTFVQLIESRAKGLSLPIPGLAFGENGSVMDGGERSPIEDIDALPFPDRKNLIYKERYSSYGFGIIVTSRGCPFQCTYCATKKLWPGAVRYRATASIIEEIRYVKKMFGTKYFNFRDDTFTLNKKRAMEICQRIKKENLGIVWRCDTRADSLDEELVRAMKSSGCVQVSVGIESGSDRILRLVKKGETTTDIKRGIRLLRKYRIPVSAFIMVGFPTESREEAGLTLDFARSLNVDTLALSVVTPYPGTEIYDLFKSNGLLRENADFSDFYHQSPKMGLACQEGDAYKEFLEGYFNRVRKYNRNLFRLLRRFIIIFASNPQGAFERGRNYFYK